MTYIEFALNCAGKEYMYYGHKVILVGYSSEYLNTVIVSPTKADATGDFWRFLDDTDVITYKSKGYNEAYQYANLNALIFIDAEKPQTVPEVKPKAPGECIAYYEGRQGMNYSVVNGCVSAVYRRQGSALKLVSQGEGINNVTEKI